MPRSSVQLGHTSSAPITWLGESKLKSSIFLRQGAFDIGKAQDTLTYLLKSEASHSARYVIKDLRTSDELVQRSSDDYMRCILAKGLSEAYRKGTPKYRNEAARKQFFKRIAAASESIHLTETAQALRDLFATKESSDTAADPFKVELDRLMDQRVDLVSEYNSKLSTARSELNGCIRQLENLTETRWSECDNCTKTLMVTSFFPPGLVESEKTWRWGTQWYPEYGILNLNPPILFFDAIMKGVIGREAAILLAPKNLERLEEEPRMLCEQSEYLAYRLLERKSDKELWAESRHGLRQKTRFQSHELIDFFHHYEMMVGESLYRELWSRLRELGNARLIVSDYFTIFNSLASRPTNPQFTKSELRLLDLLCRKPNVSPGEAARTLGLSIPTTMKGIKHLVTKAGLLFTVVVNMSKIGLLEHVALINSAKRNEAFQILRRLPYCRQIFRTYGSYDMFAVIDIPEGHVEFMPRFLGRMKERGLVSNFKLGRLVNDYQAVNFSGYDSKSGRWVVHWDTWGVRLQDSLREPRGEWVDQSTTGERYHVDKLDLNLLFMNVIDCRVPFSSMGRNLGVSGAYVGKKIGRMIREGVFRYSLWPLKIGAEDWGLVALSCETSVSSTLARYLSALPAWRGGLIGGGDFEGLLAMVWAPNGELKQLFKSIDDRVIRNGFAQVEALNSIGEWALARWLPVTKDDPWQLCTDDGKWIFDEEKYMSLIM